MSPNFKSNLGLTLSVLLTYCGSRQDAEPIWVHLMFLGASLCWLGWGVWHLFHQEK